MHKAFLVFILSLILLVGCNPYSSPVTPPKENPSPVIGQQDFSPELSTETVESIRESNKQQQRAKGDKSNLPPTIAITEPDIGDVATSFSLLIGWKATDANNDKLLISLEYRAEGGNWVYVVDRLENDGMVTWETPHVSNGPYELRISATDGVEIASSTRMFEIARNPS